MAKHVHVLLRPKVPPSRLLQSMQGATASEANRLLGRTGEKFRQAESYDHRVGDESELERIAAAGGSGGGGRLFERGRTKSGRRDESRRGRHECLRHVRRSD